MLMTDESLLELAIQGDAASFGELARRWQKKIHSFVRRYVGDHEEAEDLTQDTLAKAYHNLGRLSDPANFSAWVYKIALNECRMRFRRHSKVAQLPLDPGTVEIEARTPTPETSLRLKEERHLVREALGTLSEEQREVILMKEYQGLKFHEIAEILEIPLSTVKSRMYLGLKALRRTMENKI